MKSLERLVLVDLYEKQGLSSSQIAKKLHCSENKINYWIRKFGIKKRSISEAVYMRHNPEGDPFSFLKNLKPADYFLFGLGVGLYWGEGNKKNKNSVRLGNSDPELMATFIDFLSRVFSVQKKDLRFNLQLFDDLDPEKTISFWVKKLRVSKKQFYKVVMTPRRGSGTYTSRVKYGVITVCFNNTKLRNLLVEKIENIQKMY